jgi:FkbM family methyltransferase
MWEFLVNIFAGGIKIAAGILGERKRAVVLSTLSDKLVPTYTVDTEYGPIKFSCPNHLSEWRAETLLTKEPETIEWINSFTRDAVFWDVGANIGCYSLYAARRGHMVLAFEPAYHNYYLLNKNFELNRFSLTEAYCVAIGSKTEIDILTLSSSEMGSAFHSFGDIRHTPRYSQGAIAFSIDDLIEKFSLRSPTHIKIDIDGNESAVLSGARKTLTNPTLKSIMIEMDSSDPNYKKNTEIIESSGLMQKKKVHIESADPYALKQYNHVFSRTT